MTVKFTKPQVDQLTDADVAAAKAKRGAKSTIDYVLSQVGGTKTLALAKQHLLSMLKD